MEKLKEAMEKVLNLEGKQPQKKSVCTTCGKPATQLVDGEPSCSDHIEQVYAHQLEDYTSKHLADNEWRKFWSRPGQLPAMPGSPYAERADSLPVLIACV